MKRNVIAACILSSALVGIGSAQEAASSPQADAHYSKAQVKQLVRDAHTPDQYRTLASYYAEQQTSYLKQATEEKREWARLSQNVVGVAAKYPRPVDSARNLYEYYMYKAAGAGELSAKYGQLAAPDAMR
ncbi:MAG: hypothetical protein ACLPH3_21915 [Terracidiphilus sp.]